MDWNKDGSFETLSKEDLVEYLEDLTSKINEFPDRAIDYKESIAFTLAKNKLANSFSIVADIVKRPGSSEYYLSIK